MTAAPSPGVTAEVVDEVAHVTIDNPSRRNALTRAMWRQLAEHLDALRDRDDVAVVVVSGAGGDFSTGVDLSETGADDGADIDDDGGITRAVEALASTPAPTIAAVRGMCLGGGLSLALACDLRIADADAVFAVTAARAGILYPSGALDRLVRHVGPSAAKRLLFTADRVDAAEALRIGLADIVCEPGGLEHAGEGLARRIAGGSRLTVQATKDLIETSFANPGAVRERQELWQAEAREAGEEREGITAFRERRPPEFPWRRRSERLRP